MKIKDLFYLHQGNGLELINMSINNKSNINFISRTSENNGVVAQVDLIENKTPFNAGLITVALGGSVLSTFVQTKDFYTGFHVMVLEPKIDLSIEQKLYYCMIIQSNKYRYSYGRQANKTLGDLEIPSLDECNKIIGNNKVNCITTKNNAVKTLDLNIENWKEFRIGDIFALTKCKCGNARELDLGNDILYLGAKKEDNGVMKSVIKNNSLETKGNCIIFICDGQGSVGYSNYIESNFIGSTTLTVGYNKHLNKFNGLFIVTILDLERYKYSYGRKYGPHLANSTIKLPSNNNEPDWEFMENYIKSLPYADRI